MMAFKAASGGATPLYAACNKGDGDCVRRLLAVHAAVDQAASNGTTPLMAACHQGDGDCVQLLFAAHAAVDQANSNGVMPLLAACIKGEGVLAEARAMRERLHKKRKQESQKLRRLHATEMQMQASLSKLSLHEVTQSPPAAGSASAEAAPASEAPEASSAPPAAVALTLAELTAATDGFGEQRLIGSGGYGNVFTADALSSLRPE
ncbi:cortactin-binding protein 2, partial [Chrysochromulina tobinii]